MRIKPLSAAGCRPLARSSSVETSPWAVRAVDRTENGSGRASGVETEFECVAGHGPGVAGLVTSDTTAAVRTEILEERIVGCVGRPPGIEGRKTPFGIREFLKTGTNRSDPLPIASNAPAQAGITMLVRKARRRRAREAALLDVESGRRRLSGCA